MFVSVVVPCFRSARTLPILAQRLMAVLPHVSVDYEVIFVVDGSPDETWNVAAELAFRHQPIRAIQLARNYGQHGALLAGIRAARHDVIVTMDDDLQHPPEEVSRLLEALTEDVDLVYALPSAQDHGLLRNLTSKAVRFSLMGALGVRNARYLSSFRAFRSVLRQGFAGISGPNASIDVALSWSTTRIASVRVRMDARTQGRSGYTTRTLLRHALNVFVGYSSAPLRIVSYLGLIVGTTGVVLFGVMLWKYFSGDIAVAGFTSIASMIAVFSAAQMIALGVLGEYLGRVHSAGMGRPAYVVRDDIDSIPAADRRTGVSEQTTSYDPSEDAQARALAEPNAR